MNESKEYIQSLNNNDQQRVKDQIDNINTNYNQENAKRLAEGMKDYQQFKKDMAHSNNTINDNNALANANISRYNNYKNNVNTKNKSDKNGYLKNNLAQKGASKAIQGMGVPGKVASKVLNNEKFQKGMKKAIKKKAPLISMASKLFDKSKSESRIKGNDENKFESVSFKIPDAVKKWGLLVGIPAFTVIMFICLFSTASQTYVNIGGVGAADSVTDEQLNSKDDNWHDSGDGAKNAEEVNTSINKANTPKVALLKKTNNEITLDQINDLFGGAVKCEDADCTNSPEYKFYLKLYDIYHLYKQKYNVKLNLPLIMATLSIGEDEIVNVFSKNLNDYDRSVVYDKESKDIINIDWEYDYKNIDGYIYLSGKDFSYDMQILAKGMVKKTTKGTCNGVDTTVEDMVDSRLNSEACDNGIKFEKVGESTYKLKTKEEYNEFLKEFFEYKFYILDEVKTKIFKYSENSDIKIEGIGNLSFDGSYTKGNTTTEPGIELSSEPDPSSAINYWKYVNTKNFIYPKDNTTGLSLGAWPKNYSSIKAQLIKYKTYGNNGGLIFPTTPANGNYNFVYSHNGIDIMAEFGEPIYAPASGTLMYSEWGHTVNKGSDETAYSITIYMDNTVNTSNGAINTIYMTHMSGIKYRCPMGTCTQKVKQGELIGFVGNAAGTASSVGWAPHLHMSLYEGDDYENGLYTEKIESLYKVTGGKKIKAGG